MKTFVALGLAAVALAQSGPPSGCSSSSPNTFTITTVNVSSPSTKRDLDRRQLSGVLTLSLNNGNLKDQAGRIGYIASNYQFQFDNPVQAGARETSGFSLCSNGSLALGSTTIWYSCQSGNFYNLYSQSTGAQCIPIHIQAMSSGGGASKSGGASQISDGQPQATSPGAPAVTQITDGQPQASKPGPAVTQISDGQPQASAPGAPVSQISDGQPQASKPGAPAVSQISDGQPQASKPAAPAVSQISDGQPQASKPAAPAVSQISDGQPQASKPAAPAVSQISDGQPQASKPAGPAVSQISDGQPQASKPAGPAVSQISDGQPQASKPAGPAVTQITDGQPQASSPLAVQPVASGNFTGTSPPVATYTGAANSQVASFGGLAAGLLGLLAFF